MLLTQAWKCQLNHTNQQLASREEAGSTKALVKRCESLEKELQLSNQRLQAACNIGALPMMLKQLATMAGECDVALKRVQELLAEGRTLEAQHQELKVQLATTTTEFESRLRVANLELESKQKQYEREAKFAQDQKSEVERLTGELKEVHGNLKAQKAELDVLRAQAPPVQTMAQYQPVSPRQHYGSPMQTGTMDIVPRGHYSPTVVPYGGGGGQPIGLPHPDKWAPWLGFLTEPQPRAHRSMGLRSHRDTRSF